jgi:hypothetical protein
VDIREVNLDRVQWRTLVLPVLYYKRIDFSGNVSEASNLN